MTGMIDTATATHPTRARFRLAVAAALALLVSTLPAALSQGGAERAADPIAAQVLDDLKGAVAAVMDASLVLYGELVDTDGGRYTIEVEVEVIPDLGLARIYIVQPDALADNFIVLTPDFIYNYNYLTNQVFVHDPDDATAFGGLAGDVQEGTRLELTLDLEELFSGWTVASEGPATNAAGAGVHLLRFSNIDPAATIASASVGVLEVNSLPSSIAVYDAADALLLRLDIVEMRTNPGLDPEGLTWYPPDAEVIDERR